MRRRREFLFFAFVFNGFNDFLASSAPAAPALLKGFQTVQKVNQLTKEFYGKSFRH